MNTDGNRQREVITYGALAAILLSQAGYVGEQRMAGMGLLIGTYAVALYGLDIIDLVRGVAK